MISTFSYGKFLALTLLAVSFWINGVFMVRVFTAHGWWDGYPLLLLYVLSVPVAALCISGVRKLLSLTQVQLLPAIVFITGSVAMLHALALMLLPSIYASDARPLLLASAWLLWFCGAVLLQRR